MRGARASGGDDDVGVGGGQGVAERFGWCLVGDQDVDEVQGAQDHGLLVVELGVVGGDDDAVGEAGEHAADLDLGGVEVGDSTVDGQATAAQDEQVEVDRWRFLRGSGVDQAELGGAQATEHNDPVSAFPGGDRGVQGVGDDGEVVAVGQLGGDGVAGGSAVDADGGAGFHEFRDGPGDRGFLGLLDGGAGTVGGDAADGRPPMDPVELPGVFQFGEVAADGHAGHTEPLHEVGDVDLPGLLQHPDDVALTHR